jgi:hypothetical protein
VRVLLAPLRKSAIDAVDGFSTDHSAAAGIHGGVFIDLARLAERRLCAPGRRISGPARDAPLSRPHRGEAVPAARGPEVGGHEPALRIASRRVARFAKERPVWTPDHRRAADRKGLR